MWDTIRTMTQKGELELTMYAVLFVLFLFETISFEKMRLHRESLRELVSNVIVTLFHNLGKYVFLPPLIFLYQSLYQSRLFEIQWGLPGFLIALILVDFTYYVHHRSMHRLGLLWVVHAVHHQPRFVNLSMSTRLSFFNKSLTYWFYLPLALLGIPLSLLAFSGLVNGFYQAITHSRSWCLPQGLRRIFIDSRDHHLHHSRSPELYGLNFGGMLAIWDRIFATRANFAMTQKFDHQFADGTAHYGLPGKDGDARVVNNPLLANFYPVVVFARLVWTHGIAAIWRQPRADL